MEMSPAFNESRPVVLAVCSGNLCRSPFIEYATSSLLKSNGVEDISIVSAGTHALAGNRMAKPIERILVEDGIRPKAFRSQQLTIDLIQSADVILAAEGTQRAEVVRYLPRALPKTFTLRQYARLAAATSQYLVEEKPGARLRELTSLCAGARGQYQPAAGKDDDVVDPWQRSTATYRRSVERMREPIQIIVQALAGI